MEDLLKLQYHLWQDDVEPALEMSKRGGHLWILLAAPLLAKECRVYIHDLAGRLGLPVKGSGLADGIEVFPRLMRLVRANLATRSVVRLGSIGARDGDFGSTGRSTRWKLRWDT